MLSLMKPMQGKPQKLRDSTYESQNSPSTITIMNTTQQTNTLDQSHISFREGFQST